MSHISVKVYCHGSFKHVELAFPPHANQNSLHQVEILLVLPNILKPSFCQECPPYLPICGIYLPFQVNLHVRNSKPSNNNLFCMPESLMWRLGAVSIFHARWVILKMSGLRSSFMRKMADNRDAQSHDQKIKIKSKIIANKTPPGLMLVGGTLCFGQAMD